MQKRLCPGLRRSPSGGTRGHLVEKHQWHSRIQHDPEGNVVQFRETAGGG